MRRAVPTQAASAGSARECTRRPAPAAPAATGPEWDPAARVTPASAPGSPTQAGAAGAGGAGGGSAPATAAPAPARAARTPPLSMLRGAVHARDAAVAAGAQSSGPGEPARAVTTEPAAPGAPRPPDHVPVGRACTGDSGQPCLVSGVGHASYGLVGPRICREPPAATCCSRRAADQDAPGQGQAEGAELRLVDPEAPRLARGGPAGARVAGKENGAEDAACALGRLRASPRQRSPHALRRPAPPAFVRSPSRDRPAAASEARGAAAGALAGDSARYPALHRGLRLEARLARLATSCRGLEPDPARQLPERRPLAPHNRAPHPQAVPGGCRAGDTAQDEAAAKPAEPCQRPAAPGQGALGRVPEARHVAAGATPAAPGQALLHERRAGAQAALAGGRCAVHAAPDWAAADRRRVSMPATPATRRRHAADAAAARPGPAAAFGPRATRVSVKLAAVAARGGPQAAGAAARQGLHTAGAVRRVQGAPACTGMPYVDTPCRQRARSARARFSRPGTRPPDRACVPEHTRLQHACGAM